MKLGCVMCYSQPQQYKVWVESIGKIVDVSSINYKRGTFRVGFKKFKIEHGDFLAPLQDYDMYSVEVYQGDIVEVKVDGDSWLEMAFYPKRFSQIKNLISIEIVGNVRTTPEKLYNPIRFARQTFL